MSFIRKHIVGIGSVFAIALALLISAWPTKTFAAPYTMNSLSLPVEDMLGTAVNIFTALSPILVVVVGLGLGMWLLSKVTGFFKTG
jgi:hypothetical protein